jgi:hypothetical protein
VRRRRCIRSIHLATSPSDFDSPWKEVLERYLPDFFAFFFPQAHAEIDWTRGYEFLDKELQQVARDAELGRRMADKLVRVWHSTGGEAWVLVHIEVQTQAEAHFAQRMFGYYYRLLDRYNRQVASLAVLGDEQAGWRPNEFGAALWGCEVRFVFPVVKLLDYRTQWAALEASGNPFATVVMAHLETQATRGDAPARAQAKLALTRRLYARNYSREQIIDLFRFIDWVMQLPEELDHQYWEAVKANEEAHKMPYVTTGERIGREQGREEGLREGLLAAIELGLELKFGSDGLILFPEIQQLTDLATIQAIYQQLKSATSLNEIRHIYMPPRTG